MPPRTGRRDDVSAGAADPEPSTLSFVLIVLAGFAAGFLDVLAGGGSVLARAALGAAGLSALGASASGTMALMPAQVVTALLLRDALAGQDGAGWRTRDGTGLPVLAAVSVVGGLAGAVLLLLEPPGSLRAVEPWLILFAIGAFARGGGAPGVPGAGTSTDRASIAGRVRRLGTGSRGGAVVLAAVAVYSGYVGGGAGLLTLAALTLNGIGDIRAMTTLKIVLTALMGAAASLIFTTAGLVQWPATITLAVAAMSGGLAGVEVVKRMAAPLLRAAIIATGAVLTVTLLALGPR